MKYRKTARTLALVLAGLLTVPPVSAQAVTFADMNNVPWPGAEVSINKAAELGLVVGETINGKSYFKPKDPVSLTQSCQLAYKLMLQTGKAKADTSIQTKWSTVMNTYKIQSWAHPAVSYCLEKGVVQIADLSGFINGEVNVSATREQAAEILGRALEVAVPTMKASASATSFKDNTSISADARPYIALLNAQKIVNGDDTGNFNPKKTLNRTETAVMVTNLYNVLNSAPKEEKPVSLGTQSGTVKDMNTLYVNLVNSNAYFQYASAGVTVTLNNNASTVTEVLELFKNGSTVNATLTLDSNNRITKMVVTANIPAEKQEKDTEGIITNITYDDDDGDGKLEINDDSVYRVDYVDDVDIEITDEDGDENEYYWEDLVDLFEECEDDDKVIEVELSFYSDGDLKKIVGEIIDEDDKDSNKDLDGDKVGDITDLDYNDDDEGEIKIDTKKYEIEDIYDIDIEIDGDDADWDDLWDLYEEAEDDDEVLEAAIDLDDDDYVTDIRVSTESNDNDGEEVSGELEDITYDEDEEDLEGEIEVDGNTYETNDIEDVEIEVQDGDTELTTWEDLYYAFEDGKTIELELVVDDDEVLEITGNVTVTKGILTGFGDDYLKLEGKESEDSFKYCFTEYDRDDEDEEDDWEDDAKDIEISGLRNIDNLYEFFDVWLDDDDTDLDDDIFDIKITLDDNGFIVDIDAELN